MSISHSLWMATSASMPCVPRAFLLSNCALKKTICSADARTRVSVQIMREKSSQILCHGSWLLGGGEMPAMRKHIPPPNVVYALQIRARRLPFGNGLVREHTECRRCVDIGSINRVPPVVPIISHRRCDGLGDPVQRKRG